MLRRKRRRRKSKIERILRKKRRMNAGGKIEGRSGEEEDRLKFTK